jgi:hypothetical protein
VITIVSAAVFGVALAGMWAWVGFERHYGINKRRRRQASEE